MNDVYLEELYMEGYLDRLRARTAGVKGGLKGLGNTISAGAKGALAGFTGDDAGYEAAKTQRAEGGMTAGYNKAKLQSITNTFQNEMQALFGNDWNTKYPKLADELTTLSQGNVSTPAPAQPAASPAPEETPVAAVETPPPLPEPTVTTPTSNLTPDEQEEERHKRNQEKLIPDAPKTTTKIKDVSTPQTQKQVPNIKKDNIPPRRDILSRVRKPAATNPNIIDKSAPLKKDQTVTGAGGRLTKGRYKVVNPNANGKVTLRPLSKAGAVYGNKSIDVNREDILEKKQVKFEDTYQRLLEVPTI